MPHRSSLLLLTACTAVEPARMSAELPAIDLLVPSPRVPGPCPQDRARIGTAQFASLQDALDASVPGDTVIVCRGTHLGGFTIPHAGPLEIRGATGDRADVVLDGQHLGPLLDYLGASDGGLRLRALTARSGMGGVTDWDDSLVRVYNASRVDLVDVVLTDHQTAGSWATTLVTTVNVPEIHIVRVEISDNNTSGGAFEFVSNGPTRIVVLDAVLADNTASFPLISVTPGPPPAGPATLLIRDSSFLSNIGASVIDVWTDEAHVWIDNAILRDNDMRSVIDIDSGVASLHVREVELSDNVLGRGGILDHQTPQFTAEFEGSEVIRNTLWGDLWDLDFYSGPPLSLISFTQVDFGAGADDNLFSGFENDDCPQSLGFVTAGDLGPGDPCI